MYNYQRFQREQKIANQCRNMYQQYLKDKEQRKNINTASYSNHKKRIDAFILSAMEAPLEVDQYVPPRYQPRGFLNQGKKIEPFRMNSHTTLQRLEEIVEKNSFLDGVPFKNSSLHKFRQSMSSVTSKPLKYTPNCTAIRLADHLQKNRTNQVPSSPKLNRFKQTYTITSKTRNQIHKLLMPTLHRKAYFNSVKSLLVQGSCQGQYQSNDKENDSGNGNGEKVGNKHENQQKQRKNGKKKASQWVNRRQNAINALVKCKIMKSRDNWAN